MFIIESISEIHLNFVSKFCISAERQTMLQQH